MIAAARAAMGELQQHQRERLKSQYALSPYDAGVLSSQGRAVVAYFEEVTRGCGDAKTACNWVLNKLLASATGQVPPGVSDADAAPFPVKVSGLVALLNEQKALGLTKTVT